MTNTLTITIGNIPEKYLAELWKYSIQEAKKDTGVPVQRTDHIEIDFSFVAENYPNDVNILSEIIGGALTGHVVMTANKIFNQP